MESVIQDGKFCYLCGAKVGVGLECHHIFGGVANRPISEKYGLKVWLCHECHTGPHGAQYDKATNLFLKQQAQRAFEKTHTRAEWMSLIRKNYLG